MTNVVTIESYTTANNSSNANVAGTVWRGQSFTVGTTGTDGVYWCNAVRLSFIGEGTQTGTVTVSIKASGALGEPIGNDLASATILASDVITGSLAWYTLAFSSPCELEAGTTYVIVVRCPAATTNNGIAWERDLESTYTGGSNWLGNGFYWSVQSNDHLFYVYGVLYTGVLTKYSEIQNKAGVNATHFTQGSTVNDFVAQAEAFVCNMCRYDFVTNYATLNLINKKLLNQVVSDMVAIWTINNNMVGYTSRAEAETMINVLRESLTKGLLLLGDQQSVTYMV